jgi:hypothetical protein
MQDHHTLANKKAVERPTNTGITVRPQFEEPLAKSPRVRETKTGAVFDQELDQTGIVRENVYGPRFDFGKDAVVEILDLVSHDLG